MTGASSHIQAVPLCNRVPSYDVRINIGNMTADRAAPNTHLYMKTVSPFINDASCLNFYLFGHNYTEQWALAFIRRVQSWNRSCPLLDLKIGSAYAPRAQRYI